MLNLEFGEKIMEDGLEIKDGNYLIHRKAGIY